ncbi:MAG: hypothetical protein K8S54_12475 [Spirochaetia bacterium]|nr:hypothetical protein [Spirochaetia bacterium]
MIFQSILRRFAVLTCMLLIPSGVFAGLRSDFQDLQQYAMLHFHIQLPLPGAAPQTISPGTGDILSVENAIQLGVNRNQRFRNALDDLRLSRQTKNAACVSYGKFCNPELERARITARLELLSLVREVRLLYWRAYFYQRIQDVSRRELEFEELQLAYARDLSKAGNSSALELARSVASFEKQRLVFSEIQNKSLLARSALQGGIGFSGEFRFPETAWENTIPSTFESGNPIQAILHTHPESLLADLNVQLRSEAWAFRSRNLLRPQAFESTDFPEFQTREQLERDQSLVHFRQALRSRDATVLALKQRLATGRESWKNTKDRIQILNDSMIPAEREIQKQTLRHYNAMLAGVPELLEARRRELTTTQLLLETALELQELTAQLQYDSAEMWKPSWEK